MSEEPLVCAEYAARYIPALQGIVGGTKAGELPFLKTVATAKHYFDCESRPALPCPALPCEYGWLLPLAGMSL